MTLRGAAGDLFDALADRTYLVVDTEYTPDGAGGVRIISFAVVPVIDGQRARADEELYLEVNPQVPIHPRTTAVHGFTDDAVRRKKPFAFYAERILAALDRDDAVLVEHSPVDVHAIVAELDRARETHPTLGHLPDLPVLDTSTLPRALGLPGAGTRGIVSLATLTALTAVRNRNPHHARSDARATADAFIVLLEHAASSTQHTSSDALLDAYAKPISLRPQIPRRLLQATGRGEPPLPAAHLRRHSEPLTHPGTTAELDRWLDLAQECAALRCGHLEIDADLAAEHNGAALLERLPKGFHALTEPGQGGTLAGAVHRLLRPTHAPPALASSRALTWWANARPLVAASLACTDDAQCPSCRRGDACPRDTLKYEVARIATLGAGGELTPRRVDSVLFGLKRGRALHDWPRRHPDITALMICEVIDFEQRRGARARAASRVQTAIERGLHREEPALAIFACEALAEAGKADEAVALAEQLLTKRTTDPAFTKLAAWVVYRQAAAAAAAKPARVITHPHRARPVGRRNANPYAID